MKIPAKFSNQQYSFDLLGCLPYLAVGSLLTFFSFLSLSGCASKPPKPSANKEISQGFGYGVPAVKEENRIFIAHEFFNRARQLDAQGKSAVALSFLQIALEYDSQSRDLCFIVTDQFKRAGKTDSALAYALRCTNLPGKPDPQEYKMIGEIYLRQGKLAEALQYYEKALGLKENDQDLLYTMATLYESLNDVPKQTSTLKKLVERSDYPMRMVEKLAESYGKLGQLDSIAQLYQNAWERSEDPGFGEKLAFFYQAQKLFNLSLATWQKLCAQNPDMVQFQAQKARLFLVLSKMDSAKATFKNLMEKNPEEEQFSEQYGAILYDEGANAEAKEIFERLVIQKSDNAMYHYYLGSIALELKDEKLAELELNKAVTSSGAVPEYWAKLALFYMQKKEHEKAFAVAEKLTDRYKENWYAWYLRGVLYTQAAYKLEQAYAQIPNATPQTKNPDVAKMREKAVAHFKQAVNIDASQARVLFEMGVTQEKLGRVSDALKTLKDVVQLDSSNAVALNYLGYLLVEQEKDLDYAGNLIDSALKMEPNNGAYLDSKGWYYYKRKDFKNARLFIEQAVEQMPRDTAILEHYAIILEKLGDTQLSMQQWKEILKLDPQHDMARKKLN